LVKEVCSVAVFIKSHWLVKAAYKPISQVVNPKGTMFALFPYTRFSYADLSLQKFDRNAHVLRKLIDEPNYKTEIVREINVDKEAAFTAMCNNTSKAEKVQALRHITGPLCKMIHHLEQDKTCASWVFPLFMALQKDYEDWGKRNDVIRWFSPETILAVGKKIDDRWNGNGRLVPLKNDIWLVAFMFDPYYTPNNTHCDDILGIDWLQSICALLGKL
jgi:hypothetical protein